MISEIVDYSTNPVKLLHQQLLEEGKSILVGEFYMMQDRKNNKNLIPHERLSIDYDEKFDVLYISIDEPKPSYGEEDYEGIIIRRNLENDDITGVTIIDYRKRNKDIIKTYLPFILDFDYVDRNITN